MERRSTSRPEWLAAVALLVAGITRADGDQQEAFRDLGAVLGWRLAPEAVEERCRILDPPGIDTRRAALTAWLMKNSVMIASVDSRVAEVVPLVLPGQPADTAVRAVREQVRQMVLEPVTAETCKAAAKPEDPLWTNNGVPFVPESLAALYDWQVRHTPRR